jgi:3D (Asp-Asp-Asp) domain-containing protein
VAVTLQILPQEKNKDATGDQQMKDETYRAARLFWFSALLLSVSISLLTFTSVRYQTGAVTYQVFDDFQELDPSPEPPDPRQVDLPEDFENFVATAYSISGTTSSGVQVNTGIVAADPKVLPLGSVIEIRVGSHAGIYTVLDTGGFIKGKRIDIYFPDYEEALEFGRRDVYVRVLRHGWSTSPPSNLG